MPAVIRKRNNSRVLYQSAVPTIETLSDYDLLPQIILDRIEPELFAKLKTGEI